MIGGVALVGLAAATLVAAPSASGTPTKSVPIRVGVGIGPINLGMSGQQVRRALGTPTAVVSRRVIRGRPYVVLQWGYGAWDVGLLGRAGNRRVVLVRTSLPRHRTPEGLGIGSDRDDVWRGLAGVRERRCLNGFLYWVHRRGRSETVLHPTGRDRIVSAVDVRSEPVLGCVK
jgi:hypothetical protein